VSQGIAIAGFMGVGKTTTGRMLARRLNWSFFDLDDEISCAAGRPVAEIFATEGQTGFRRREAVTVQKVLGDVPCVLALGGGTVHHGDNLANLRPAFWVVSLVAPWDHLVARIGPEDLARPLWGQAEALYRERAAGYLEADAVVQVANLDAGQVVDAVQKVLPW
jgi:shikimate kinase